MADVMEQLSGVAESSEQDAGALSETETTQETALPASSDDVGTTEEQAVEDQAATQRTDWKSKHEGERQARERAEKALREKQAEADSAKHQLSQALEARKKGIAELLSDPDTRAMIEADPKLKARFENEVIDIKVAEQLAVRDQTMARAQAQSEWSEARESLVQWFCAADDGPKMTMAEFNDWDANHGQAFTSYKTAEKGLEAAKVHIRGLYFPKFAEKQQVKANEKAHRSAEQTLKHGSPPGSAATSLGGKDKTPQERYLSELENAPGFMTPMELFTKTK